MYRVLCTGYWVLGSVYRVLGAGYWVLGTLNRLLGSRFWVLESPGQRRAEIPTSVCWMVPDYSLVPSYMNWNLEGFFKKAMSGTDCLISRRSTQYCTGYTPCNPYWLVLCSRSPGTPQPLPERLPAPVGEAVPGPLPLQTQCLQPGRPLAEGGEGGGVARGTHRGRHLVSAASTSRHSLQYEQHAPR